jgi:hypothetical protein
VIRKSASAFIICVSLLAPLTSNATIACGGLVAYLSIDQIGQVSVGSSVAINTICSTESQGAYSATVNACKLMYATLLSAKLTGKSVTLYYSNPALTSCGSITQWSNQPSMYFVELPQ